MIVQIEITLSQSEVELAVQKMYLDKIDTAIHGAFDLTFNQRDSQALCVARFCPGGQARPIPSDAIPF